VQVVVVLLGSADVWHRIRHPHQDRVLTITLGAPWSLNHC